MPDLQSSTTIDPASRQGAIAALLAPYGSPKTETVPNHEDQVTAR